MKRIIQITMLALVLSTGRAWANELTQEEAVRAITGEALHDSESMRYMAHALRNRFAIKGDLKGVYGAKGASGHIGPNLWQGASKAWFMSAEEKDVTHGATHWLSDYDLAHCKPERMTWRFKMVETVYQGQTHYYRKA